MTITPCFPVREDVVVRLLLLFLLPRVILAVVVSVLFNTRDA